MVGTDKNVKNQMFKDIMEKSFTLSNESEKLIK